LAFEELKQRHAVIWGSGPYQGVTETIRDLHEAVIERLDPQPGERLLDLATGTGAVAELAAATGTEVVGIDIAPALIEQAKERAAERGLDIEYRVGDAEALDLEDASFDLVSSTCGVMFAGSSSRPSTARPRLSPTHSTISGARSSTARSSTCTRPPARTAASRTRGRT
jgi:SAM-dependent methyltransferase